MSDTIPTNMDSDSVERPATEQARLPYHTPRITVLGLIDSVVTGAPEIGSDSPAPGPGVSLS
jgi:hypothetical protein